MRSDQQHQTTIISTTRGWDGDQRLYGYRAVCSDCQYRSPMYPMDRRHVAEIMAHEHTNYHATVAQRSAATAEEEN